MSIKTYYSIDITEKGYYLTLSSQKKPGNNALKTLQDIEVVVKHNLQYLKTDKRETFDLFTNFERMLALKDIALEIQKQYLSKKNKPDQNKITEICIGIANRITPPSGIPLTTEIIFEIIRYTGWTCIAQLNRSSRELAHRFIICSVEQFKNKKGLTLHQARHCIKKLPKTTTTWTHLSASRCVELLRPAAKMNSTIFFHVLSVLDDKKALARCCEVSKNWKSIAQTNKYWLNYYLEYFPETSESINFRTRLCNYLNNISRGLYVEVEYPYKVVFHQKIDNYVLLLGDRQKYELIYIDDDGNFCKKEVVNYCCHLSKAFNNLVLIGFDAQNLVIKELDGSGAKFEIVLPSTPRKIYVDNDVMIEMQDNTLHKLCKSDTQHYFLTRVAKPIEEFIFKKCWSDWLIISDVQHINFYVMRKEKDGQYTTLQIITIDEPTQNTHFDFCSTSDGTKFMFMELHYNFMLTVCVHKCDEEERKWNKCQYFDQSSVLEFQNDQIALAKFYQSSESDTKHKHTCYIETWNLTKDGCTKAASMQIPYHFYTSGHVESVESMAHRWKLILKSYSWNRKFLFLRCVDEDIVILDKLNFASKGTIHKGSFKDLQLTRGYRVDQNNRLIQKVALGVYRRLNRSSSAITQLGFTQQQHLITLDNGFLKLRRFDVSESEVLENLAERFASCTTQFSSETEINALASLYFEFSCLSEKTKQRIYKILSKILKSTHKLKLEFNLQLNEEARAEKAFYNGAFMKPEEFWNYTSDPIDIAGALLIYSQQLILGVESIAEFIDPDQWDLMQVFLEDFDVASEDLQKEIEKRKYTNDVFSKCKIVRLCLQKGDLKQAEKWAEQVRSHPNVIDYYLNGFRSEVAKMGLIYRSLIDKTSPETQDSMNKVYRGYAQACDLLDKLEDFFERYR